MFIVLDGPDCGGKTSLAKGLGAVLGIPVHKLVAPRNQGELLTDIKELLLDLVPTPCIFDRWRYPTDKLYSPIVEGRTSISEEYEEPILEAFKRNNVFLVYVYASPTILLARYNRYSLEERAEDYIKGEQLLTIAESYQKEMQRLRGLGVPVLFVDTSYLAPEEALRYVSLEIVNHYLDQYVKEEFGCM